MQVAKNRLAGIKILDKMKTQIITGRIITREEEQKSMSMWIETG